MKKLLIFLSLFLGITSIEAMTLKPTGVTKTGRGENITVTIVLNRTGEEKQVSGVDAIVSWDSSVLTLTSQTKLLSDNYTTLASVSNGKKFSYGNLTYNDLITTTTKNIVKLVFKVNDNAPYASTDIKVTSPTITDDEGNPVKGASGGTLSVNVAADDSTLKNLTLDSINISNFSSSTLTYSATYPSDKTSVVIGGAVNDPNATVSGFGTKTLSYGANVYKVTVTSAMGTKKIYTLTLTREDSRSKINTLKTLSLDKASITFSPNTYTYNVTVLNDVDKLTITSSLTDEKSKYVSNYGNRTVNLSEGLNKILVKVTSESGSTSTYTLNVTRASANATLSTNNNIKTLAIENYAVDFKPETLEYTLKIASETELNITADLEDSKANYIIEGNQNLVNGSVVTIKVTSEDGTLKEYKIKIVKDEKEEKPLDQEDKEEETCNNSQLFTIILIVVVVLQFILILILFTLLGKKKRKTKKVVDKE